MAVRCAAAPILRDHDGWRVVAIDFAASAAGTASCETAGPRGGAPIPRDVVKDALGTCDGVSSKTPSTSLFVLSSIAPGMPQCTGDTCRSQGRALKAYRWPAKIVRDIEARYDAAQMRFGKGQKVGDHRTCHPAKPDGTSCFYLNRVWTTFPNYSRRGPRRPQSEARLPAGGEPRDEYKTRAGSRGDRVRATSGSAQNKAVQCFLR